MVISCGWNLKSWMMTRGFSAENAFLLDKVNNVISRNDVNGETNDDGDIIVYFLNKLPEKFR